MEFRVGQGIDIHKFARGRPLVLGGVTIPFEFGLEGHSDADVLLHSMTDALLGAAGKGDIGTYFPNTDPQWKGADSLKLLSSAYKEVVRDGWQIENVDVTVLAEAPKLVPHIPAMKSKIGEVLGLSADRIGIKATTTETLGFTGRREGIVASCVALLRR